MNKKNRYSSHLLFGKIIAVFLLFLFFAGSIKAQINSFPYVESFENTLGQWSNATGDDFDWTNFTGSTPSANTGPSSAHDGLYYVYAEANDGGNSDQAFLVGEFDFTSISQPQFSFLYHMYGSNMGSLMVMVFDTVWTQEFIVSGEQQASETDPWAESILDLSHYGNRDSIIICFRATLGNGNKSDIGIDLVSCYDLCSLLTGGSAAVSNSILCSDGVVQLSLSGQSGGTTIQWETSSDNVNFSAIPGATGNPQTSPVMTKGTTTYYRAAVIGACTTYSDTVRVQVIDSNTAVNSFPYLESFENGLGIWLDDQNDDFDWTIQTGGTPTNNTGPSGAHDGSFYIFTEGNQNTNSTANLNAILDLTSISSPQVTFKYHMFGNNMGTLNFQANNNGTWTTLWSATGAQQPSSGAAWGTANIDMTVYGGQCAVQVRFNGLTGGGVRTDMAVDSFAIEGPVTSTATWTGTTNNDWGTASNWDIGMVPGNGTDVIIPDVSGGSGNYPVLSSSADVSVRDIQIDAGAQITLGTDATLRVYGNLTNNGLPSTGVGTVSLEGGIQQNLNGSTDFNNLTIDNGTVAATISGSNRLIGTLEIPNGVLQTNNQFTIVSDNSGNARVGEITTGAVVGHVTMQRYLAMGATGWRFFSSAVSGVSLNSWNDDFITSGFTGTDFPSFPFVSMYTYEESLSGTYTDGFVVPSSISQSIGVGEGLWAWAGDSLGGTNPFTVDVSGDLNAGNINLPVTFTSSGGITDDGWNLLGNPYPSAIDWDAAGWTKTNIDNAVYVWNTSTQSYSSYVGGVGTNGGSRYIAASQAFEVHANAASPALVITESAKTTVDPNFLRPEKPNDPIIKLQVTGPQFSDEVVVRFMDNASADFDRQYDAAKLFHPFAKSPNISVLTDDSTDLAISSVPYLDQLIIPVKLKAGMDGVHTIELTEISELSEYTCKWVVDLKTNEKIALNNGLKLEATMSEGQEEVRWVIHLSRGAKVEVFNANCNNTADALVEVSNSNSLFKFHLYDSLGVEVASETKDFVVADLYSGNYQLTGNSEENYCESFNKTISVGYSGAVELSIIDVPDTVIAGEVESIEVMGLGNSLVYSWSLNDQHLDQTVNPYFDLDIESAGINVLSVEATDISTGCRNSITRTMYAKNEVPEDSPASMNVVEIDFDGVVIQTGTEDALTYSWFDITGRELGASQQVKSQNGELFVPYPTNNSGHCILRLMNNTETKTFNIWPNRL